MSDLIVCGKHNKLWKVWRRAGQGRGDLFFMEHREAVLESLQSDYSPYQVLLGTKLYEQDPARWEDLSRKSASAWYLVQDDELDRVLSVKGSNGLCGLFRPFEWNLEAVGQSGTVLVTWQIQDPGNLGTLIRSCSGLVGGGVLCVGGCRPWSSKVARASAGGLLRCPVRQFPVEEGVAALSALKADGFSLFAAVPREGLAAREVAWTGRDAILVGNESHGLPKEIVQQARAISLTMTAEIESLNAGVAGSILLHERARRDMNSDLSNP
jgi:tRNA G18 (ribose-2'-O)-methylase SpoU